MPLPLPLLCSTSPSFLNLPLFFPSHHPFSFFPYGNIAVLCLVISSPQSLQHHSHSLIAVSPLLCLDPEAKWCLRRTYEWKQKKTQGCLQEDDFFFYHYWWVSCQGACVCLQFMSWPSWCHQHTYILCLCDFLPLSFNVRGVFISSTRPQIFLTGLHACWRTSLGESQRFRDSFYWLSVMSADATSHQQLLVCPQKHLAAVMCRLVFPHLNLHAGITHPPATNQNPFSLIKEAHHAEVSQHSSGRCKLNRLINSSDHLKLSLWFLCELKRFLFMKSSEMLPSQWCH